jgi:PAS domain S-box-containing protein
MATILVVDDRQVNREFLKTLLGYRDHRVLDAGDGAEALELIKSERPDLVISDILMPTMDGYQFVREMRADPASANIPVIFNTAHYLDREAKALAEACGVSRIIFKPGEPELILSTVDDVLGDIPASTPPVVEEQFDREHVRVLTDKLSRKTEDLRRVNERMAALIELGHQMAAERDPHYLLESFCHSARRIVGAKYAAIAVLDEDSETLLHFFTSGMTTEAADAIGSPPAGRGLLGFLLRDGGVVSTREIKTHPRSEGFPPNHPAMNSFLGAAISSSSGKYGALYLTDKIGCEEFSDDDEKLISMLTAQVGIAYENAKRFEELQRRATELEGTVKQRQHAEEALRETNQTLQSLVQTSPLAIIATDLDGNVKSWNSAAEQMFGWTESEVSGRLYSTLTDYNPQEIDSFIEIALQGGIVAGLETKCQCKDGSLIDVSISSAALRDARQNINGVMAVIADITERKHLEHQFLQAQKMEAVGRLAGGIAHDFNNLLTAIIGYSQMSLSRLHSQDPMRKDIEEVESAGQRAAALTGQLLAFSRKQVVQPQVLDLNTVVTDLTKMLQRLIGEDVELQTSLDPDAWNVKVDRGQIEQIIMNLAVNSRDAMPDGGKLTIETSNVQLDEDYANGHIDATPGPYVMLAIADTGSGMDKETESRIFEPFFTTKEQGRGTGLGLSTVYGIVKQSGGSIGVYSELGQGTTFKVYLPRIEESVDLAKAREDDCARGTETVLLVEDSDTVRKLARKLLEEDGYKVLEASSGDDGWQVSEHHQGPIDLLLTDLVMPGTSGREIAQRLMSRRPQMRVLYMSGYTDDAIVRHRVLDAKAPFIQKPFTRDALIRKVREVLDAVELDATEVGI